MSDIGVWYEMAMHAIAAESHHDIRPNLVESLAAGNNGAKRGQSHLGF